MQITRENEQEIPQITSHFMTINMTERTLLHDNHHIHVHHLSCQKKKQEDPTTKGCKSKPDVQGKSRT